MTREYVGGGCGYVVLPEPTTIAVTLDGDVHDAEPGASFDAWPSASSDGDASLLGSEHVTVEQAIARVRACAGLEVRADVREGAMWDLAGNAAILADYILALAKDSHTLAPDGYAVGLAADVNAAIGRVRR